MLRCPFITTNLGWAKECMKEDCALYGSNGCAFRTMAAQGSSTESQNRGDRISISIADLKALVKDAHMWWALESGGVDNWEWYGDSLQDAAKEWGPQYGIECEYMCEFLEEAITDEYLRKTYEV